VTIGHTYTHGCQLFGAHHRRQKDAPVYNIAMRWVFYTENISNLAKTYASYLNRQGTTYAGAISRRRQDWGKRKVAENS
jgi:hypothetical protein